MENIEVLSSGAVIKNNEVMGVIKGFQFHFINDEDIRAIIDDVCDEGKVVVPLVEKRSLASLEARQALSEEPFLLTLLKQHYEKQALFIQQACLTQFSLAADGLLYFEKIPLARLQAGQDLFSPEIVLLNPENVPQLLQKPLEEKAKSALKSQIEFSLKPLYKLKEADFLVGVTAKIKDALLEKLGFLPRSMVFQDMKQLDQVSRAALRHLGIRFGAFHLYLPLMLRLQPLQTLINLWILYHDLGEGKEYLEILQALRNGRTSLVIDSSIDKRAYWLCGFSVLGKRAVRVDILERLADLIRAQTSWQENSPYIEGAFGEKKFYITASMLSILGATKEDMHEILTHLGYVSETLARDDFDAKLALLNKNDKFIPEAEPVGSFSFVRQDKELKIVDRPEEKQDFVQILENTTDPKPLDEALKTVTIWHYAPKRFVKRVSFHGTHQGATSGAKKSHSKITNKDKDGSNSSKMKGHRFEGKKFFKKPDSNKKKPEIDVDSPFSSLAQLRQQMLKNKDTK